MSDDSQKPPFTLHKGGVDGGSAGADPQLTETLTPDQLKQLLSQDIYLKLSTLCAMFAPHAEDTHIRQLVPILVREQLEIREKILPTVLDEQQRIEHDGFGVIMQKVNPVDGKAIGEPFPITGPKQLQLGAEAGPAASFITTLMLMVNPEYRGLLRFFGIATRFVQAISPNNPNRRRIALVKPGDVPSLLRQQAKQKK